MEALPKINLSDYRSGGENRRRFLQQLDAACSDNGFFYLEGHGIDVDFLKNVLSEARRFFELPTEEKQRIHIRHSPHFRGYSVMKNERDWREQIHFGREIPAHEHISPEYLRLEGPNLWPGDEEMENFKRVALRYMDAVQQLGNELLQAIAETLQIQPQQVASEESGYLLIKMISYYAQPNAEYDRPGVAAHCDWSWLTILLQDEVGGLEVLSSDGSWVPAPPLAGALSVNTGELLAILTRGKYKATAHRVINPSEDRQRISLPAFINPPLGMEIHPLSELTPQSLPNEIEHVHRVMENPETEGAFLFGESEWQRKGQGRWCYRAACLK